MITTKQSCLLKMSCRFFVVALMMSAVHAAELPALQKMVKEISIAYKAKTNELAKRNAELSMKVQNAKDDELREAKENWRIFQESLKKETAALAVVERYLSGVWRIKQPSQAPLSEDYKKLQRVRHLSDLIQAGDIWAETCLGKSEYQAELSQMWTGAKKNHVKELESLAGNRFLTSGAASWETKKSKEGEPVAVVVKGRALRRALQKSRDSRESVLEKKKRWNELNAEEKAKVVIPQK